MTPIADMVAQMLAAGVPHETILLAVRTAELARVSGGIPVDKTDAAAERRRAYDRERKRKIRGIPPENPQTSADPLSLTKEVVVAIKEPKKERSPRKSTAEIPQDWRPPERAYDLGNELRVSVAEVEATFRDYLKSTGRRYVDYDAAFCNFVRNSPKFKGSSNGPGRRTLANAADDLIARAEERDREERARTIDH